MHVQGLPLQGLKSRVFFFIFSVLPDFLLVGSTPTLYTMYNVMGIAAVLRKFMQHKLDILQQGTTCCKIADSAVLLDALILAFLGIHDQKFI